MKSAPLSQITKNSTADDISIKDSHSKNSANKNSVTTDVIASQKQALKITQTDLSHQRYFKSGKSLGNLDIPELVKVPSHNKNSFNVLHIVLVTKYLLEASKLAINNYNRVLESLQNFDKEIEKNIQNGEWNVKKLECLLEEMDVEKISLVLKNDKEFNAEKFKSNLYKVSVKPFLGKFLFLLMIREASVKAVKTLIKLAYDHEYEVKSRLGKDNYHPFTPRYDMSTYLSAAVIHETIEIVELLLKKGAPPNETDKFSMTPLHYAVKNNQIEIVKLLLDHNADPRIKDKHGNRPIDLYVKQLTDPKILEILSKAEKRYQI